MHKEKEPLIRLTWHGKETADKVAGLLDEVERIEILLAPEYHHVLFSRLYPNASRAQLEDLDVEGGPQLLSRIADIEGLEELAELEQAVSNAHANVKIKSPATIIITLPGASR